MQTSINLQNNFFYPLILFILLIVLIIGFTVYLIYEKRKQILHFINKFEPKVKEIPEKNIKNIPVIKNKFLKQLEEIETDYENKKIKLRIAYQKISQEIRMFVFEVTDITTQNYSLSEIKKLKMPELYNLIEEYYEPEFSSKPEGDFKNSITKARRVINEWK